jgi:hypothetical protein
MRPTFRVSSDLGRGAAALVVGLALVAGCSEAGPGVDGFHDDSIPRSEWTTPSAEYVRASGVEASKRSRDWEPSHVDLEPMGSPHWPLWWEDPFEDKGSTDGQFCATYEDIIAAPYSVGRYLVNTMFWPASVIVTPPGTVMISDGYLSKQILGYDHDAIPGSSWAVDQYREAVPAGGEREPDAEPAEPTEPTDAE